MSAAAGVKYTPFQEFIFYRTYSRWQDALKRRETYGEVFGPVGAGRYLTYMSSKFGDKVPATIWELCARQFADMGVMPSMRAAWTAGPALDANNISGYNCAAKAFNDLQSVVEQFYILMCGTGHGFAIEREYGSLMPVVKRQTGYVIGTHAVGDSKEGWADSLKLGLETWFEGSDVRFDFSGVRPAGARLKTMGGRASGPEPLRRLLDFCRDIVLKAQGRQLTSIEWLDIGNMIGEVVVVGGVRRSSEISFSDLEDELMRHAKDWPFPEHRRMSNNSAVFKKKPSVVEFMREWAALAASGTGERGIFNLEAAQKSSPRRKKNANLRTNPCVPGSTEILTSKGYRRIDELVGQSVSVWNGWEWSEVTPRITGYNQQLLKVSFSSGQELEVTPAHKFWLAEGYSGEVRCIEAGQLAVGNKLMKHEYPVIHEGEEVSPRHAYTQGFLSGDSMDDYGHFLVYFPKFCCLDRLLGNYSTPPDKFSEVERISFNVGFEKAPKSFVPHSWNAASRVQWLSGFLDADGTELKEGGAQVVSIDRQFLLGIQKMLTTLGVSSKVTQGRDEGYRTLPDGRGGNALYLCQKEWRLLLGATQIQALETLGLSCSRMSFEKSPNRDASRFVSVTKVEPTRVVDTVYCFTEPKRHLGCFEGIVTGQCGEINLDSLRGQFCNLTEVVVRVDDDLDGLLEKVKAAVWLGAMQACLTDFPYLRPSYKEACDEERLLGVSLTGQLDNPKLLSADNLAVLRGYAIKVCRKACKALGINMSAAITTGKPSGTVSQLVNCASGAHARHSQYYIRNVRIDAKDPLFLMMRSQGVEFSPETGQRPVDVERKRAALIEKGRTKEEAAILVPDWNESHVMQWVVGFPIASPKGCLTRYDVTAMDQLEWYLKVKQNWCEHNQSMTVYVKDEEWLRVGSWVYDHFDDISGVSFLPFDGGKYEQMPYEEIDETTFKAKLKAFPKIDFTKLSDFENDDNTSGAKSYACSGDKCEAV